MRKCQKRPVIRQKRPNNTSIPEVCPVRHVPFFFCPFFLGQKRPIIRQNRPTNTSIPEVCPVRHVPSFCPFFLKKNLDVGKKTWYVGKKKLWALDGWPALCTYDTLLHIYFTTYIFTTYIFTTYILALDGWPAPCDTWYKTIHKINLVQKRIWVQEKFCTRIPFCTSIPFCRILFLRKKFWKNSKKTCQLLADG